MLILKFKCIGFLMQNCHTAATGFNLASKPYFKGFRSFCPSLDAIASWVKAVYLNTNAGPLKPRLVELSCNRKHKQCNTSSLSFSSLSRQICVVAVRLNFKTTMRARDAKNKISWFFYLLQATVCGARAT